MSEEQTMNKPKKTYTLGNTKIVAWDNDGMTNYTVEKFYKDEKSDEWKTTKSFNLNELNTLARNIDCANARERRFKEEAPDA